MESAFRSHSLHGYIKVWCNICRRKEDYSSLFYFFENVLEFSKPVWYHNFGEPSCFWHKVEMVSLIQEGRSFEGVGSRKQVCRMISEVFKLSGAFIEAF